jgi:hypothetical protein
VDVIPFKSFDGRNWKEPETGNNYSFFKDEKENFIHVSHASTTLAPYMSHKRSWDSIDIVTHLLKVDIKTAKEYLLTNFAK